MKSLDHFTLKAFAPLIKSRGAQLAPIVLHWLEIAGPELAPHTWPEKLVSCRSGQGLPSGKRLVVRVQAGFQLDLQMQSPLLLSRLRAFAGAYDVQDLLMETGNAPLKGSLPAAKLPPAPCCPVDQLPPSVLSVLDSFHDEALRASMLAWATHVYSAPVENPSGSLG